jgi:hypothetical protein
MENLKSILESLKNIPRENKMAYLVSVGMGVGASISVTIIPSFFSHGTGLENNIFAFSIFAPIPILSIVLLLVLSKKFSNVWNNIKTRTLCVVILSIICMYCLWFIIGGVDNLFFMEISLWNILELFVLPVFIILSNIILLFVDPIKSPLLITFLYSNIFIIIATYLATKGITNLPKRIILFIIIVFLICATAATPLLMNFLST